MANMENEDKWLNALRRHLKDYEVSPSDDVWQKLERELKAPSDRSPRIVPLWIKTMAAAMIIGVAGGSWLYFSHYLTGKREAVMGTHAVSSHNVTMLTKRVSRSLHQPLRTKLLAVRRMNPAVAVSESKAAASINAGVDSTVSSVVAQNVMAMSAAPAAAATSEAAEAAEPKEQESDRTASKEKPQNWYDIIPESDRTETASNSITNYSPEKTRWVVSLTAMNGLPSIGGNMEKGEAMAYMSDASVNFHPMGGATENDYATIPQPLPDKQTIVRSSTSVKHKIPVSYGAAVRYNFTSEWGVESGLSYTILNSSFTNEGVYNRISYDQNLHYLEVPLRINYMFLNRRWFSVYAAAGGAVAKCVYAKIDDSDTGTTSVNEKPWQFSVSSAIGAQLNIVEHVGFYIEPGVGYYFKDNSDLRTVYKDHPWVFKLNFGLRLSY